MGPGAFKMYDLEDRTEKFAKDCRSLIRAIPKDIPNIEDCKQLVRASGQWRRITLKTNENLGKKDFLMKMKISRKESKESRLWLRLISTSEVRMNNERERLIAEATELLKILSSIIGKSGS